MRLIADLARMKPSLGLNTNDDLVRAMGRKPFIA